MIKLKKIVCLLVLATLASDASAHSARRPYLPDIEPLEARGCYAYRGKITCGTYCYWEVNGLRYCQQREYEAVPQLGWWDDGGRDQGASGQRTRSQRRGHVIK